jgi:hypothetical protein
MKKCHWHPERDSATRCDSCKRHICDSCATDVSEPPMSYQVCPQCLESLEYIIERGLNRPTGDVRPWRTWLGSCIGVLVPLTIWIGALFCVSPHWYPFVQRLGYIFVALGGAIVTMKFSGDSRGMRVAISAVCAVLAAIGFGHYVTTNAFIVEHLTTEVAVAQEMLRVGLLRPDHGWWLPVGTVLRLLPITTVGMDYGMMLASLYLTYALTHRRRLWKTRFTWFR